jgi:hypothetical protein
MFEYHVELARRIEQFAAHLKRMQHRAHQEVFGNCFIVFQESPNDDLEDFSLTEQARQTAEQLLVVSGDLESSLMDRNDTKHLDLPPDSWRQDDSESRFIQFSFQESWFCLDIPRCSLYQPEGEKIMGRLNGFFYVRDRPQFMLKGEEEDIETHNPFRKVYLYGDEPLAASEMAFIFFDIWKFPVDWQFYVTAGTFGDTKTDWETDEPLCKPAERLIDWRQ